LDVPVLTWTFPATELRLMFGAPPRGARTALWDPTADDEPAGLALDDVHAVLVPDAHDPRVLERVARAPHLRFVQLASAWHDGLAGVLPGGVTVADARGVHADGAAELAVGLALAQLRGIDDAARRMAVQHWSAAPGRRASLAGSRVLVVGAGALGTEVVARLRAFRASVTVVARTARETLDGHVHGVDELPHLLPRADVVVLAVPLTDATTHLVDEDFLAAMHDDALLVNVAHGRVVDTDALVDELGSGRLRAALDVTDPSPLPPDHLLWRAPNALVTPGVGRDTPLTAARLTELARRQLTALLAERPLENVVAGPPVIPLLDL
jgi:phosphoglycerate dehydrogenase-like enzyme